MKIMLQNHDLFRLCRVTFQFVIQLNHIIGIVDVHRNHRSGPRFRVDITAIILAFGEADKAIVIKAITGDVATAAHATASTCRRLADGFGVATIFGCGWENVARGETTARLKDIVVIFALPGIPRPAIDAIRV